MSTPQTELDEYHIAIQKLQTEIERYRNLVSTVDDVAISLARTQQAGTAATKSLITFVQESEGSLKELRSTVDSSLKNLSNQVADTLSSIRNLNLDDLHAETQSRYDAHQSRLDRLGKDVQDAVREQQRQGLEMLQHTTTLQNELARYANQVEQSSRSWGERQAAVDTQLRSLASQGSTLDSRLTAAADQASLMKKLMFVIIALVIALGIISLAI